MISDAFHDVFLAASGASGALIGLLFVAISVAPDRVVGPDVPLIQQLRASSALTALLTPLVLSLIALIPATNVGYAAMIIGIIGLIYVAASLRRLAWRRGEERLPLRSLTTFLGFVVVLAVEVWAGIRLIRTPHDDGAVSALAGAVIASLSIGVERAWELVGARRADLASSIRDLMRAPQRPPDQR